MSTVIVSLSIPREIVDLIDQRRGQIPRSRFVAGILAESIREKTRGGSG